MIGWIALGESLLVPNNSSHSNPRDDLVEDRAIKDADDDHFGHSEFAAQAAQTIEAIRTPANIAIYAPWGSGKTSLAHLLGQDLDSATCGFVYFDAFKYAEAPLRREFIRRVAKELGVKDKKFDRGLYEEETTSGFSLKKESVASLLRVIGWIAVAAVSFTSLLALILAHASDKAIGPEWADNVRQLLPAIFAPAVIVGPVLALIKSQLDVSRKRYAPQSDEEFERLFRELVDEARSKNKKWDRIVIFVDELDRCAADEVASTLETLRTFLEVDRCVFVVAADRSVLETAVAMRSRQETPYNVQNPYYSVGSSYLDKIFQYQWQLPPMMPSSLTRFAQALVKDRTAGLWADLDAGEVVSVLVPLHVQSPRRVKELLNAYAMTYRIAERRIADGHLEGELRSRAAELAKLVCLQLEFPMFASDLPNEPRLPQFILRLEADQEAVRPPDVTQEVWDRAKAYSQNKVQLDVVIAGSGERITPPGTETSEAEADAQAEVVTAHGHLLIRYLQKTSRIPGPEADLIFLEGVGSAFGLPTALAIRLKAAATEGRMPDVKNLISPLPPDQQLAALQLLAVHVREALPGVEGDNALRTLLGAIGVLSQVDLAPIVDELADAANTAIRDDRLPAENVVGAVVLGLATTRAIGSELVSNALAHGALLDDAESSAFIAGRADDFAPEQIARLGEIIAALLVTLPWDDGPQTVIDWSDARAVEVLAATQQPMLDQIAAVDELARASVEAAADPLAVAPVSEETTSIAETVVPILKGLIIAAREAGKKPLLEALLQLTLGIDHTNARAVVVSELPPLGLVSSASLTDQLLMSGRRRAPIDLPKWLDALDPTVFSSLLNAHTLLEQNVVAGYKLDSTQDTYLESVQDIVASAARLATTIEWFPVPTLTSTVVGQAALPPADVASMTSWFRQLQAARILEKHGLVNAQEWRPSFITTLAQLAATAQPDDETRTFSRDVLIDNAAPMVETAAADVVEQLFEALANSPWLLAAERCLARVRVAKAARTGRNDAPLILPVDEFVAGFDASPDATSQAILMSAIGEWLSDVHPSIDDAWTVLNLYPDLALPEGVRSGLSSYATVLSPGDRTALARLALANFPEVAPNEAFLDTERFHDGDLDASVELVTDMFAKATNEDHRRSVMRLWTALRLTDSALIGRLVAGVMKPLIQQGKTSREVVLQNLNLVQGLPNHEKREIAELLVAEMDEQEWSHAEKRLVQAGLMHESRGGLFSTKKTEHLKD